MPRRRTFVHVGQDLKDLLTTFIGVSPIFAHRCIQVDLEVLSVLSFCPYRRSTCIRLEATTARHPGDCVSSLASSSCQELQISFRCLSQHLVCRRQMQVLAATPPTLSTLEALPSTGPMCSNCSCGSPPLRPARTTCWPPTTQRRTARERFAARALLVLECALSTRVGKTALLEQLARAVASGPGGGDRGDLATQRRHCRLQAAGAGPCRSRPVILSSWRRRWWGGPLITSTPRAWSCC